MKLKTIIAKLQDLCVSEYTDDFTTRLQQVNHGLIRKGNIAAIKQAVELAPATGDFIEIGTFTGTTVCLISYFTRAQKRTNRIFSCDRWDYGFKGLGDKPLGLSSITGIQWGDYAKETALNHIRFFAANSVHPMLLWSNELLTEWAQQSTQRDLFDTEVKLGGPVAFAFIDGNHDYEFVKADFEAIDRLLMPGGVILFDDSADHTGSPGVCRFMQEAKATWLADGRYKLIAKHSNYLVQKKA